MAVSNEKEFWSVGIDKTGDWVLRKTPVGDWSKPDGDTLVEVYKGDIKDIKVEFDGVFERDYSKSHFELWTGDLPWVFVLMNDGRLYAKKPNQSMSDVFLIDSKVSDMYPCRGWKSADASLDMGLILGYIKEGKPYYAVYKLNSSGSYGWEVGNKIDDSDNNRSIVVIRLNDYRIGIQVISDEENRMYITPRLYIGGTVETSHFTCSVTETDFVMLNPSRVSDPDYYAELNPVVTLEEDSEKMWVRLHCSYPFVSNDSRLKAFNDPTAPTGYSFTDMRIDDSGDVILVLNKKLNSVHSHVKFSSIGFNRLRFQVTEYCKPVLPVLTFETESLKQSVNESFRGSVLSIQASVVVAQKRKLSMSLTERFNGSVSIEGVDCDVRKHELLEGGTDAYFRGSVDVVAASIEFEFSGKIIG